MTNKKNLLIFTVLLASYGTCVSQRYIESYLSVQGTWDKVKDVKRARFGGNNLILNRYLADQYFSKFSRHFIGLAMQKNITINVTAELVFVVNGNNIDSTVFVKSSGFSSVDTVMLSMLRSTSGKWIPGRINDTIVKEEIKIWIHIFSGNVGDKPRGVCIQEGDKYFTSGEYQKAIRAYDKVIYYDELHTIAVSQKGLALVKMGNIEDACSLWRSFKKYDDVEIPILLKANCE